jgi:hypothetical protein
MVKKFYFYIKNINVDLIEEKYGLQYRSNVYDKNIPSHNITPINNLSVPRDNTVYSFLDETKKNHDCYVSMQKNNTLVYHCFWCRHKFNTLPIGCPIKFINSYVLKKVHSNITKNCYILKENIIENQTHLYENKENYTLYKRGYYLTDGSFCSFNCCQAFIQDNNHDKTFNNSTFLLNQLYNNIFNMKMNVKHAPSWRLLSTYGGHLSIDEFRESFKKVSFVQHHVVEQMSNNTSIGHLFEKKINF